MRTKLLAVTFAIGMAFGVGAPVGAQDDAACADIEPRDAAFFQQVAATPEAEGEGEMEQTTASPVASPSAFTMPEGEAASEEAVAEVTALYEQLISCLNAGDFLRAYAFYSDEYLLRNLSAEAIASLDATPVPVEESTQTEFGSVLEARMLEDGRIAALIVTSNAQTGDAVLFSLLEQGDQGWKIQDEAVVEVEMQATPEDEGAEATPAA